MKSAFLSLILSLAFLSVSFAQEASVVLNSKHIQVNSFETTLLRNSSSPKKVFVTAPEWKNESVCRTYGFERITYPCNGPCYNETRCYGNGRNRQCHVVTRCARTMCSETRRVCTSYSNVPLRKEKTIKLVFRSPKKLQEGQEEKYFLTTATQESINATPTFEAENATCHNITKRANGGKFVIKINKSCE